MSSRSKSKGSIFSLSQKWYDEIVDLVKSILDFSLFLDPKFALINFSILLLFIWFVVPYFYITEHLQQYGMNADDGAFLISVIGIFNTIGMIAYGWLGDKPWVNVTKTYAGNMIGKSIDDISSKRVFDLTTAFCSFQFVEYPPF